LFDAASGGGGEQRLRRTLSFDEAWTPSLPEKKPELEVAVQRDVASGEGKLEEGGGDDDAAVGQRCCTASVPRSQPQLADTAQARSDDGLGPPRRAAALVPRTLAASRIDLQMER
jgi:hypothetical protein